MTKLHIISDIHLEFADMPIPEVDADITIIAGDLHTGISGLWWARKLGRPVIYVPGNHEYYGHDMDKVRDQFKKQKSAYVLNNEMLAIDDVDFFGCTLWTNFNYNHDVEYDMKYAQRYVNDFKFIRYGKAILTPKDTVSLHNESRRYIQQFMDVNHKNQKTVIITHHLPAPQSIASHYEGSGLNPAFASDLQSLVSQSCATLWIHGHTHESCDYMIGKTRVICNPRGYPPYNSNFNPNLVVEV